MASQTKYYYFAGRCVAMRTSDGVTHIHGDHLGSATNTTGPNAATQRYFPWGATRSTTIPTSVIVGTVASAGVSVVSHPASDIMC
ncbi:MAG: hypothetical protein Kow00123_26090 [Anaerolineales bacterium]